MIPFLVPNGNLRHDKSLKSFVLSLKIKVLPFSDGIASRTGLGTLWGSSFGFQMAPTWLPELPRRLQDDPGRLQDTSKSAPGPPKTPPGRPPVHQRRPQDSPRASKTGPGAPKKPPRGLQGSLWALQEVSKSSPEELSKLPAAVLQPLASGMQVASAGCANR